jgi:hypothetical protein
LRWLPVAFACSAIGCAGWLQEWKTNPVAAATQLEQWVQQAVSVAQAIWQVVYPKLGDSAISANKQFQNALFAVQEASDALVAGTQAEQDGKTVNLAALAADVERAVQDLDAVVARYVGHGASDAGAPSLLAGAESDDLTRQVALLHKIAAEVKAVH